MIVTGTPSTVSQFTLTRTANILTITPLLPELLSTLTFYQSRKLMGAELAAVMRHRRMNGDQNMDNRIWEPRRLYEILPDQSGLITPGNLTARVCETLKKWGKRYVIDDQRPALVPPPDYTRLPPLRGDQPKAIAAIVSHDSGLIDFATAAGKSFMIGAVAAMWHTVPMLVVAPRLQIVNTLYDYLSAAGIDVGRIGGGYHDIRRVTICCSASLGTLNHLLDEVRVVIYDEVYTAGSERVAQALARIPYARMYGFADGPLTRSDGRNIVIESLFGPVIASYEYQDAVQDQVITPLQVVSIRVGRRGYNGLQGSNDVVNKRNSYWRHDGRNTAIAESVLIVAEFLKKPISECQILIICETVEHALRIHPKLPNFTLCHAPVDAESRAKFVKQGLNVEALCPDNQVLDAHRVAFERGELKHVIVTPIWSAGVNFRQLAALIRADGMTSKVANRQFPGRLSRLFDGKEYGLVVDFYDEFNQWAESRSQRRLDLYESRGWTIHRYPIAQAM